MGAIPLQAAKAYDKAAVFYRGPGAEVNFPRGQPQPHGADQVANGVQSAPAGDGLCGAGEIGAEPEEEQQGQGVR